MTAEESRIHDLLHHGTADQVRQLRCPITGSSLRIEYSETSNGKRHVQVKGTCSDFIMRLSGLPAKPTWVAILGEDFVTLPPDANPKK